MLRIGGKAVRGIKGSRNAKIDGYRNIDITSDSRAKIGPHSGKEFSPLVGNLKVMDNGREFQQFENWWQGNKVYRHLGHVKKASDWSTTKEFKKFQDKWAAETKGHRVIPESKLNGKRTRPLFAVYNGLPYSYIDGRWIYTSKYCEVVKITPVFKELKKIYKAGESIMLIDHDGPDSKEYPEGQEVTWDVINEAFVDLARPYGHSYVLAAMLLES